MSLSLGVERGRVHGTEQARVHSRLWGAQGMMGVTKGSTGGGTQWERVPLAASPKSSNAGADAQGRGALGVPPPAAPARGPRGMEGRGGQRGSQQILPRSFSIANEWA